MKKYLILLLCSTFLFSYDKKNEFVVNKKSVKIDYTDKILNSAGQILKDKNKFDLLNVNLEKELLSLFDKVLQDKLKLSDEESKNLLKELEELNKIYKNFTVELNKKLSSVQKILKR